LTTEESIEEDTQNVKADNRVFLEYVDRENEGIQSSLRATAYLINRIFLFSLLPTVYNGPILLVR
jgi:hypothetical protein